MDGSFDNKEINVRDGVDTERISDAGAELSADASVCTDPIAASEDSAVRECPDIPEGTEPAKMQTQPTRGEESASAGESEIGARGFFTTAGICYTVLSVIALGFSIFLACMCVASSVSASAALKSLMAFISGESVDLADALVALISGVVSLIAFGLAAIFSGRISSHLVKRAAETETGVLRTVGRVVGAVSLAVSIAVFLIAAIVLVLRIL